ncbi:hypothetical protein GCM10010977_22060 [Citricoccus zhacaiensis]|uniref:Uncharacterized protein n=1 Tax=Citricoccus zhacaiensis TaxID=489142 RepID=A0ABQ2M3R3_9MICC|nr:DUF6308 family protein [Citricoccus zhacaiensis]GGO46639.1 hypothetical protein GCM10010977_22060 [Citricoccus zhacaiensis]
MVTTAAFTVAGIEYTLDQALDHFAGYPRKTPARFDYPPPGDHGTITPEEIRRTRYISSRISHVEGDYFIARAANAPWITTGANLADADPEVRGGLFDNMSDLYWHFAGTAPRGISFAKVSKVLHLKFPAAFPLLDSRLWKAYRTAARAHAARHPDLRQSQLRWIAVRDDLLTARSSGAIEGLRDALARYKHHEPADQQRVRDMTRLTDLRLLDILVW